MARNQKLTGVIHGRAIVSIQPQGDLWSVHFADGSIMTVKTGTAVPDTTKKGTVKAVRQRGTTLNLDFEDGTSLQFETAEATSSVLLRDKDQKLEYAD